jgi:hypothetical protein
MKLSSLITASTAAALAASATPGHSEAANYLSRCAKETWRHFHTPVSLGEARLNALALLYVSCARPNWDGHNAAPISESTYEQARRVLEAVPSSFPPPSLGADPDGMITLEWHASIFRTLSISVSSDGDLHYAALFGAERHYGTVPFLGQLPSAVLPLIERIAIG